MPRKKPDDCPARTPYILKVEIKDKESKEDKQKRLDRELEAINSGIASLIHTDDKKYNRELHLHISQKKMTRAASQNNNSSKEKLKKEQWVLYQMRKINPVAKNSNAWVARKILRHVSEDEYLEQCNYKETTLIDKVSQLRRKYF